MTGGGFKLVLNRPAILFPPSSVLLLFGVKGQGEGESSLPARHISKPPERKNLLCRLLFNDDGDRQNGYKHQR